MKSMTDLRAALELQTMGLTIGRGAESYFRMGKFSCKKTLVNGAVVRVSITMPSLKKAKP